MCLTCRFEPNLVEDVVKRVLVVLNRKPLAMPSRLIGMGQRVTAALKEVEVEQHQTATEAKVKVTLP